MLDLAPHRHIIAEINFYHRRKYHGKCLVLFEFVTITALNNKPPYNLLDT